MAYIRHTTLGPGVHILFLYIGCPRAFAERVPHDYTPRKPQIETFWGRLEIDRKKVSFYARPSSSV